MQRDSLPEGAAQGGGRQMPTVLVVDDTPDNLAMMAELLGERYRVKVANSGEHALKAMQAEVLSILQEFRYETSAPGEDEKNNEQASSSEESNAA